jgi:hypothetical protein
MFNDCFNDCFNVNRNDSFNDNLKVVVKGPPFLQVSDVPHTALYLHLLFIIPYYLNLASFCIYFCCSLSPFINIGMGILLILNTAFK